MRVAIVGYSGYIGRYLVDQFSCEPEVSIVLKIGRAADADEYLNLENSGNFCYETLSDMDYVVFTAAISSPDKCASEYDHCWKVNVIGTSTFIRRAIERNCRVLFFSSDAVFGNIPSMIYNEQSDTRPITAYGQMKKAVEDQFKGEPNFKAIRLPYVVSNSDRFVSYCLNCIKDGIEAEVFHPLYRNCIVADDVVKTVVWFMRHWDEYEPVVLNVAGSELVSRVRIADELNQLWKGGLSYRICRPNEAFYYNRPAITQMKSLYLEQYGIVKNQTFTEKMHSVFNLLV